MVCAPGGRESNPINLSSGKQVWVRVHPCLIVCFGCPTAFAPVPTEAGAALWQCVVRSSPWPLFCVMFCARMPCRYTCGHLSYPTHSHVLARESPCALPVIFACAVLRHLQVHVRSLVLPGGQQQVPQQADQPVPCWRLTQHLQRVRWMGGGSRACCWWWACVTTEWG